MRSELRRKRQIIWRYCRLAVQPRYMVFQEMEIYLNRCFGRRKHYDFRFCSDGNLFTSDKNNFAPVIGVAWDPFKKEKPRSAAVTESVTLKGQLLMPLTAHSYQRRIDGWYYKIN